MSIRVLLSTFLLIGAGSLGCESENQPAQEAAAQELQAEQPAEDTHAGHSHEGHGHSHEGHGHSHGDGEAGGHDCGMAQHSEQLQHDRVEVRTAEDGTRYTHAGAELVGVPEVKVSDLVADPHRFEGQTVTVTGNISTMCGHRRTWFGVVNEGDQSGSQVQIQAAPSFLAPAGSVGKRVRVEGKVEIVEMPANRARYLAAQHRMGEPEDIEGTETRAVIVATGADFF